MCIIIIMFIIVIIIYVYKGTDVRIILTYDNICMGNCVHFRINMSITCKELLIETFK